MTGGHDVRALRRDELRDAARALTASFDEEPLFRWMLPGARRRAAWLYWFHVRALGESLAAGGACTLEAGAGVGSIAFFPPRTWPPKVRDTLASIGVPTALPTWKLVAGGLHVERVIARMHPPEPHVYVYVLGVHPDRKGKGYGAALLRRAFAMADELRVPVHLETSNPVNLPFYRHFGLEVANEVTSHGGPPVWTLTARARQSDAS